MRYRAVVERGPDGFSVTFPALPGICVTGATEMEALEQGRRAIAEAIEFDVEHRAEIGVSARDIRVEVTTGTVLREGLRIQLRGATLALLISLATQPGELSREELCARLYPGGTSAQAYNALKMAVHRARQQLGAGHIIETTERGYRLAEDVVVDIRFLPQVLRSVRLRRVAGAIESRLPSIFEDLYRGRPAAYDAWEWFAPTERLLERTMREIGLYLGHRALARAKPLAALEAARRLISKDLLDEAAYELAIRAHLARGNRPSALMEYRSLADRLKTELGIEPSPEIQNLLGGAAP